MHKLAKDGYLFVTWANHHYTDFAMSWVARLRALGLTNYLVGAMDNDILSTLARRSVHTFSMQSGELQQSCAWMSVRGWTGEGALIGERARRVCGCVVRLQMRGCLVGFTPLACSVVCV